MIDQTPQVYHIPRLVWYPSVKLHRRHQDVDISSCLTCRFLTRYPTSAYAAFGQSVGLRNRPDPS